MYYPSVLPKVIFSCSQVLLDKVIKLVHFSYDLHSSSPPVTVEGKWLQFPVMGKVTVEDEEVSANCISELFTSVHLITISAPSDCIAPLSSTEYFVPSLLQMITSEAVTMKLPPLSTYAIPLCIHFPAGCAQNGGFCALVV